jgi:transcriptional regulator with XRE-family HTH domain
MTALTRESPSSITRLLKAWGGGDHAAFEKLVPLVDAELRRLTQAKAAKILRVTQPRVSDLLRGRIDLFSTDSLIDMLARLGMHVRFVLKSSRRRLGSRDCSFSRPRSGSSPLRDPRPEVISGFVSELCQIPSEATIKQRES